jgi:hypothetical protein
MIALFLMPEFYFTFFYFPLFKADLLHSCSILSARCHSGAVREPWFSIKSFLRIWVGKLAILLRFRSLSQASLSFAQFCGRRFILFLFCIILQASTWEFFWNLGF